MSGVVSSTFLADAAKEVLNGFGSSRAGVALLAGTQLAFPSTLTAKSSEEVHFTPRDCRVDNKDLRDRADSHAANSLRDKGLRGDAVYAFTKLDAFKTSCIVDTPYVSPLFCTVSCKKRSAMDIGPIYKTVIRGGRDMYFSVLWAKTSTLSSHILGFLRLRRYRGHKTNACEATQTKLATVLQRVLTEVCPTEEPDLAQTGNEAYVRTAQRNSVITMTNVLRRSVQSTVKASLDSFQTWLKAKDASREKDKILAGSNTFTPKEKEEIATDAYTIAMDTLSGVNILQYLDLARVPNALAELWKNANFQYATPVIRTDIPGLPHIDTPSRVVGNEHILLLPHLDPRVGAVIDEVASLQFPMFGEMPLLASWPITSPLEARAAQPIDSQYVQNASSSYTELRDMLEVTKVMKDVKTYTCYSQELDISSNFSRFICDVKRFNDKTTQNGSNEKSANGAEQTSTPSAQDDVNGTAENPTTGNPPGTDHTKPEPQNTTNNDAGDARGLDSNTDQTSYDDPVTGDGQCPARNPFNNVTVNGNKLTVNTTAAEGATAEYSNGECTVIVSVIFAAFAVARLLHEAQSVAEKKRTLKQGLVAVSDIPNTEVHPTFPSYFAKGLGLARCDSVHLDTTRMWESYTDVLHSPYFGCTLHDVRKLIFQFTHTNPKTAEVLAGFGTGLQAACVLDTTFKDNASGVMSADKASALVLALMWSHKL